MTEVIQALKEKNSLVLVLDTYGIIQFRNPTVGNGKSREQYKVNQSVDVTFFSEIQRQRAVTIVSSSFQIGDNITKERERSEHSDLLPGIEFRLMFMISQKRKN